MNVEEVLERAKVHIHSDFDDCNNGIYTTWIVSNSDKPITKEESEIITSMYRNAGKKQLIVFLPTPKENDKEE